MAYGDYDSVAQTSFRLAPSTFTVTFIDDNADNLRDIERALRQAGGSFKFVITHKASPASCSFPLEPVHAIVFTANSLARATAADVDVIRAAMKPGTCRVYLLVPNGQAPPPAGSALDEFVQRTDAHTADAVAAIIIAFFRNADELNRRAVFLGVRDRLCLGAYQFLKILWPVSYLTAALHTLNAAVIWADGGLWPGLAGNSYIVQVMTFGGVFFIVHCAFGIVRNGLFATRIMKQVGRGYGLRVGALGGAAAVTAFSIAAIEQSAVHIFVNLVLAAGLYWCYLYTRRIRGESSSLSQLQAALVNTNRRAEILALIGRQPFTHASFPLLPFRSKSLFISYMHSSAWSSDTAALIHQWAIELGFDVFRDASSIPPGSLWRQLLLRALSECGWFIVVLDGDATLTEWVLAESAYAALLRKSIGKPRILLVVKNLKNIEEDEQNPFRAMYLDVFQLPPRLRYGAAVLSVDTGAVTKDHILRALEEVQPMSLLS